MFLPHFPHQCVMPTHISALIATTSPVLLIQETADKHVLKSSLHSHESEEDS
uniref:Uncharacterized protein n=1 Tax=Anguilla anguilla TaxID=7936 RepID=A0A0E9WHR6_ANGAN